MKNNDEWLCLLAILLTIITFIFFFSIPKTVSYQGIETEVAHAETKTETKVEILATSTTREKTAEINAELPELPQVLLDIAWCESRDNQDAVGYNYHDEVITLEDGSTTTQKVLWSKDIGRFQINDYYHAETARKMGYDIYTVEGNTLYAIVLYNSNGTKDWNPSKPCWSDIEAWRAKHQSYY